MITRISDPGLPYSEQPSVLQTLHLQAAFFGFSTLQFWKVVTTRIKVAREVLCVGFFSRLFRSFVLLVGLSSVCLFTSFQMVLRSLQGELGLRTLQPWSMTASGQLHSNLPAQNISGRCATQSGSSRCGKISKLRSLADGYFVFALLPASLRY